MYKIKQNPEDFLVEEVTPEGEILEYGKKWEFDESSKGEGDQLICVLEKVSWDTHLALKEISKRLRISRKRIGFAGTKDKKAVSTQRISLWNVELEKVKALKVKDLALIPLRFSRERVNLGDLKGNRFTIKVYSDKKGGISSNVHKIPNKFGVQRFGDIRPITHLVGEQIIEGNLEKAVKIYLAEVFEAEREEAREARRKLAESWDYKEALKNFPKWLKFERTMISHLSEFPNDYAGALRKLPKFLKIMFTHSYQAYLFNKFLDEVIKRNLDYEDGPLYGFETKFKNELEKEILEKEGLKLEDFRVKSMPEMSSKGMRRPIFIELNDFKVLEKKEDYYVVRFSLPKGCYATVVIDFLFG